MRVIIRSWSFAFVLIEACSSVAAPSSNMHFVYKYMYEKKIIKIKINIKTADKQVAADDINTVKLQNYGCRYTVNE